MTQRFIQQMDTEQPNWEIALADMGDLQTYAAGNMTREGLKRSTAERLACAIRVAYRDGRDGKV